MKILLIEDEPRIGAFIKKGLTDLLFSVTLSPNGIDGHRLAIDGSFDVVVLDNLLPDVNGIEVCRMIRRDDETVPILMLSAQDAVKDRVDSLDNGADDFLGKPFYFDELVARIKALGRRRNVITPNVVCRVEDLEMDFHRKEVRRDGRMIHLSLKESKMLEVLLRNKNKVLSRAFIAQSVWGVGFAGSSNYVDVYISYLRTKIDKPFPVKILHTVAGLGYIIRD